MGKLPMFQFATGGIVTPTDIALMMQLGYDAVFLEYEIFNCLDPYKRVQGIIQAVRHYNDPHVLVETSCGLEDSNANLNLNEDKIEQFAHGGSRIIVMCLFCLFLCSECGSCFCFVG